MLKLLDDIIVDGKDYTYVDNFSFNSKIIKCYLGEDYLFTVLSNNREYIIRDEWINYAIKEQECLNNPEFYYFNPFLLGIAKTERRIKGDELDKLRNNFLNLIRNSRMKVNLEKISSRLSKVKFYEGYEKDADGIYHPATNSVIFKLDYSNYKSISTMVHEMIHACGGRIFNFKSIRGFIEGSTQLTTQRLLGRLNTKGDGYNGVIFDTNFGQSYTLESAIIRQMEYLLNESVSESILEGKMDFFRDFKNKYGRQLYRFLKHRTNRLLGMNPMKSVFYFLETQEIFFKKVFDKEIKNVDSLESAKIFINKLKNFEYVLGNIPGYEAAVGFEEYYEKKLNELENILKSKKISKLEIDNFILNNRHKKVFFKNSISITKAIQDSTMYMTKFARYIVENKLKFDLDRLDYYIGTCGNNIVDYLLTYDNEPVYYIRRNNKMQMKVINKDDVERTKDGFRTYYDDHEIDLKKVVDRRAVNMSVSAINNQIEIMVGNDTDLLISENQNFNERTMAM